MPVHYQVRITIHHLHKHNQHVRLEARSRCLRLTIAFYTATLIN